MPFSFLIPSRRCFKISSIIMATSVSYSYPSSIYINKVTKGDCPLVVMSVLIWYCMVCTPSFNSDFTRSFTSLSIISDELFAASISV